MLGVKSSSAMEARQVDMNTCSSLHHRWPLLSRYGHGTLVNYSLEMAICLIIGVGLQTIALSCIIGHISYEKSMGFDGETTANGH